MFAESSTGGMSDVEVARRLESTSTRADYRGLTILLTGANSGIGLAAAKMFMLINPLTRLILVARSHAKAASAKAQVLSVLPSPLRSMHAENIIPLECDHCSLQSVRDFNVQLRRKLKETYTPQKWALNGLDVVCLNAAVLMPDDTEAQFTEDGFEVTFQTNHLAPFLLVNLVQDLINPGGRVVLSTSGLHSRMRLSFDGMIDRRSGLACRGFDMMDGSDFHFKHSYALSKLCNVAVCASLNEILKHRLAIATCFSPGLMTTSGLFRHQKKCESSGSYVHKDMLQKEKSISWGAGALVFMAIADATGLRGGEYWGDTESLRGDQAEYGKDFRPTAISDELISKAARETLWALSCELTELISMDVPSYIIG